MSFPREEDGSRDDEVSRSCFFSVSVSLLDVQVIRGIEVLREVMVLVMQLRAKKEREEQQELENNDREERARLEAKKRFAKNRHD